MLISHPDKIVLPPSTKSINRIELGCWSLTDNNNKFLTLSIIPLNRIDLQYWAFQFASPLLPQNHLSRNNQLDVGETIPHCCPRSIFIAQSSPSHPSTVTPPPPPPPSITRTDISHKHCITLINKIPAKFYVHLEDDVVLAGNFCSVAHFYFSPLSTSPPLPELLFDHAFCLGKSDKSIQCGGMEEGWGEVSG